MTVEVQGNGNARFDLGTITVNDPTLAEVRAVPDDAAPDPVGPLSNEGQGSPSPRSNLPALPSFILDPCWEQFAAMLPERNVVHSLGVIDTDPDRVVFDEIVAVVALGAAYERIAGSTCSETAVRTDVTNGSLRGSLNAWNRAA